MEDVERVTTTTTSCRHCGTILEHTFCDLGMSPMANSYLAPDQIDKAEKFYPLHAYVCSNCLLVQLAEFESPDAIFSDYAYFSSFSSSWLEHARIYVEQMIERFGFDSTTHVMEIASNDGYLLKNFVERGISVLGVEPAANVAAVAVENGIDTEVDFFGTEVAVALAKERTFDLIIGNNVLAHVPDLNDFVAGMAIALAPTGVITMEFPHLLQLMLHGQFDTIYHEHFSYFSFLTVSRVFASHGLRMFDVEQLRTHGGSLRIYACHRDDTSQQIDNRVAALSNEETEAGLAGLDGYLSFGELARTAKNSLLTFLIDAKRSGKSVAAYGAPAKGNTLLNYAGARADFIDYTVDRSPYKQDHFLPGTHIPIFAPEHVRATKPDYLLILPWNLKDEVMSDMAYIREWGGRFVIPIPETVVFD